MGVMCATLYLGGAFLLSPSSLSSVTLSSLEIDKCDAVKLNSTIIQLRITSAFNVVFKLECETNFHTPVHLFYMSCKLLNGHVLFN